MATQSRNDRHDPHWAELMLIRAGHYLWAIHRKECGKSAMVEQERPFLEALETIFAAKRELRAELAAQRADAADKLRAYWKQRKAAA